MVTLKVKMRFDLLFEKNVKKCLFEPFFEKNVKFFHPYQVLPVVPCIYCIHTVQVGTVLSYLDLAFSSDAYRYVQVN